MSDCALIIVTKDRVEITEKCLKSLFLSDQNSKDYDIFIIDNCSSPDNLSKLKNIAKTIKSVKRFYSLDHPLSIPLAFNLGMILTKDYKYRVKLDSDMLVPGFSSRRYVPPQTTGDNPGAPAVASFITGASSGKKQHRFRNVGHTRFIDYMKNVIKDQQVGIAALVPISPHSILEASLKVAGNAVWREIPYLMGGCMMIPKETFDKLGYFDERLPRKIDIEYSQRAIASGMNVGYSSDFGLIHLGEGFPAEGDHNAQKNNSIATTILYTKHKTDYVSTAWEEYFEQIKKTSTSFFINLSDVKNLFIAYDKIERMIDMSGNIEG